MHDNYTVTTCLGCMRRELVEARHMSYTTVLQKLKVCRWCNGTEIAITRTGSYGAAQKLVKTPMQIEFVLAHRMLLNKNKIIQLLQELVNTCANELARAEVLEEPQRLKSIARWLRTVTMSLLLEKPEDDDDTTKTTESIGEAEEQQAAGVAGVAGDVSESCS